MKYIISAQFTYDPLPGDEEPCQPDKYIKNFDQSEDSKYFELQDFFHKANSKKILLLGEYDKSYHPQFNDSKANQFTLDLVKLRNLMEHSNLA